MAMKCKSVFFFTLFCSLFCLSGVVSATVVTATLSPGEEETLYIDPPQGQSGIRILNESGLIYKVEFDGMTPPEEEVAAGYQLVDETIGLTLSAKRPEARENDSVLPGRARIRLSYDRNLIRTMGFRERELTLMRLVRKPDNRLLWRPCSRIIEARHGRAIKRVGGSPVFARGYYGVDFDPFVWAVMDLPGQYAIGIPEPTAMLLFAAGASLLAIRRKKQ